MRRDWHWLVRFARPELGMLPHSFGRDRIERTFWAMFADRDLVDPSVADIVVDEFERIYRSPGRPARVPLERPRRSTSSRRRKFYPRLATLAAARAVRLGLARPADPGALPPARRALAAERRARRARGLRPRARRSRPGAHERPAGAVLRARRPARRITSAGGMSTASNGHTATGRVRRSRPRPGRGPRRARPRLHPRDAPAPVAALAASTSAARCAGSATCPRTARCCSSATTPAAT